MPYSHLDQKQQEADAALEHGFKKEKDEFSDTNLNMVTTQREGQIYTESIRGGRRVSVVDDVFGEIGEEGPNYRNVGWLGTSILMMKTQIGLGVLAIPVNFHVLGMIPGLICLLAIAGITTWSDYIVGVFKLNHRSVYGIDDVGEKILGRPGRILMGTVFVLFWIFCAGSAMLGISIGLNSLSDHGACTAIFVAVSAIVAGSLASIQTLGKISWLAWVGITSILTAIFTLTIAVGVQTQPAAAPVDVPFVSDWKLIGNPSFTEAMSAISSLVFAYAGTPGFFSIISEMRDPKDYTKSMLLCQGTVTVVYSVIGIVVYYYCGSFVASPALGSAGYLMKKVCYGLALPGLLVSGLIMIHLPAKYCFVRLFKGSKHLTANTMIHWAGWFGCTVTVTIIAYVIASSIPVFGGLVSLVGALFGTLMCFQPMGCMWLYDNLNIGQSKKTLRWTLMVCWSVFVIVIGTFLMIGGTYGSVVSIMDSYKISGGSAAFSCADNSASGGGH